MVCEGKDCEEREDCGREHKGDTACKAHEFKGGVCGMCGVREEDKVVRAVTFAGNEYGM